MSVHIGAKKGETAQTVLLPGDPLRAKYIAENFLEGAICYNEVRGMLGYTGTYKGMPISVQGTGMGMPSAAIYIHELIHDYGAKRLIRVGSCGAIQAEVKVRDVIIAQAACSDSSLTKRLADGVQFAPIGNFLMIKDAYELGNELGLPLRVGNVFSSDAFYNDTKDRLIQLGKLGVLAVEMETAVLYALAAKFHVDALSILTVSDHVLTGEETTALERQTTFNEMIELALKTALKQHEK